MSAETDFYEAEAHRTRIPVGMNHLLPEGPWTARKYAALFAALAELLLLMYFNLRVGYLRNRGYYRKYWFYWTCWALLAISVQLLFVISDRGNSALIPFMYILFPIGWAYYYLGNSFIIAIGKRSMWSAFGRARTIRIYEILIATMWMAMQISFQVLCIGTGNDARYGAVPVWLTATVGVLLIGVGYGIKGYATWLLGVDTYFVRDQLLEIPNEKFVDSWLFRSVKHPMCLLGYVQAYGFALLCRSAVGLAASVALHLGIMFFIYVVEVPGIRRLYGAPTTNS